MVGVRKSYYAIIPANVRYDKDLIDGSKLLYGEITALCNQEGYCWASNSYFSELYGVSKKTISKWINQLKEKGYVDSMISYKEGTKQVDKRYLTIVNTPMEEKVRGYGRKGNDPMEEKFHTPMEEKVKDNNTVINTTSNNTINKEIVEIVNYLNSVTGKKYNTSTRKTRSLIKARMNEGFTLVDFKKVIDIKNSEWSLNQKMSKYLRPETLFGTKFESYLNQEVNKNDPYDGIF